MNCNICSWIMDQRNCYATDDPSCCLFNDVCWEIQACKFCIYLLSTIVEPWCLHKWTLEWMGMNCKHLSLNNGSEEVFQITLVLMRHDVVCGILNTAKVFVCTFLTEVDAIVTKYFVLHTKLNPTIKKEIKISILVERKTTCKLTFHLNLPSLLSDVFQFLEVTVFLFSDVFRHLKFMNVSFGRKCLL